MLVGHASGNGDGAMVWRRERITQSSPAITETLRDEMMGILGL